MSIFSIRHGFEENLVAKIPEIAFEDSLSEQWKIWDGTNVEKLDLNLPFRRKVYAAEAPRPYVCVAKRVAHPGKALKIVTENGYEIVCSEDQKICILSESWNRVLEFVEVSKLSIGNVLKFAYSSSEIVSVFPYHMQHHHPFHEFESNYGYIQISGFYFDATPGKTLTKVGYYAEIDGQEFKYDFKEPDKP